MLSYTARFAGPRLTAKSDGKQACFKFINFPSPLKGNVQEQITKITILVSLRKNQKRFFCCERYKCVDPARVEKCMITAKSDPYSPFNLNVRIGERRCRNGGLIWIDFDLLGRICIIGPVRRPSGFN